ncbi:hypothetical protein SGLAM104S_00299 [Streptomyces glaucescens]
MQARTSRSLDEEAFDDAVMKLRGSLLKLAQQAGRGLPQPGDGVAWLLEAVAVEAPVTSPVSEKSLRLGSMRPGPAWSCGPRNRFSRNSYSWPPGFAPAASCTLSASVSLDELLADLGLLGTWSDPAGVEWADDLRSVSGVVRDAHTVQQRLAGQDAPGEVAPDDVPALLGDTWKGELSEFQRRDIAKLLSLQHGANFSVPGPARPASPSPCTPRRRPPGR